MRYIALAALSFLQVTQASPQTAQPPTIGEVAKNVKDQFSKAKNAHDVELIRMWCQDQIVGTSAAQRISIYNQMLTLVQADKPIEANKLLDKVTALDDNDKALVQQICIGGTTVATTSGQHTMADSEGFGTVPCAVYAKRYQEQPDITDLTYGSWLDGFVTGFNGGVVAQNYQVQRIDIGGMDRKHRDAFMHDYCSRNPLKPYMEGVLELMTALPKIPKGQ